jgi:large subunit ribosomal protein L3
MAGRLGGERTTVQNLLVHRIDTNLNLIFVKGNVPGPDDAHVLVTDAKKKMQAVSKAKALQGKIGADLLPGGVEGLPFPAGTKEMEKSLGVDVVVAPAWGRNPFVPQESS